jgi:hypothetical protein
MGGKTGSDSKVINILVFHPPGLFVGFQKYLYLPED